MAQSRKDSRGYALRSGEPQRADGRCCFTFTDRNRKRQYVCMICASQTFMSENGGEP
jgi:hypothetical protein